MRLVMCSTGSIKGFKEYLKAMKAVECNLAAERIKASA